MKLIKNVLTKIIQDYTDNTCQAGQDTELSIYILYVILSKNNAASYTCKVKKRRWHSLLYRK